MKNPKNILIAALFFVSLVSASILVLYDFKPLPQICNVGEGCYAVKNSPYNSIFFGIPNEYLAFVVFLFLFVISLFQVFRPEQKKEMVIKYGIYAISVFAVYSIYLQAFVIRAYCKYCMAMDVSILLALALVLFFRK